jgi:hypothetical protein
MAAVDRAALTRAQKDQLTKLMKVAVNCVLASWDITSQIEELLGLNAEDAVHHAIDNLAAGADPVYKPAPADLDMLLDAFEEDNE